MKNIQLNHKIALAVGVAATFSFALMGELEARPYQSVVVEGSEFIAASDITAACDIEAGVDYAAADLRDRRDCLLQSGQFQSVSLLPEGDILRVVVAESNSRPGRVEVGLAYDSRDGIAGNVYFQRYNLFPNTFGAVDLSIAKEVQSLQTYLYQVGTFGDFDFGIDTLLRRTDYEDQGFKGMRSLIEPYLAYGFHDHGRIELGLGYRKDEMRDVTAASSQLFQNEAGVVEAPFLRLGLRYARNKSDLPAGPLTGLSMSFDQYFWALGETERSSETRVELDVRYALGASTSVLIGMQGGLVSAKGDAGTRAVDRFFIGGADFRGFSPRGIGPKDGGQFVGANKYYVASVEVQKELHSILGTTGRIGLFTDVGSAWSLDSAAGSHGTIDDGRHIRSSVGLSLTLDVGSVPVSAYLAKPVQSQPGDDRQTFGISFSTRF